jgi:ribonucleoside-triphosphate reductase
MAPKCTAQVEVWSRVCGFFRPVSQWNKGKKQEYADRTPYQIGEEKSDGHTQTD